MDDCIFCKIVAGEIPSDKVYEDEEFLAFHDIRPVAPVHFMVIPKSHVPSLEDCDERHRDMLGRLMLLMARLAREQGLGNGFRTVINTGRGGGQEVPHLHVHAFGGGGLHPM
jgi:histidine triad (HIT) family protein